MLFEAKQPGDSISNSLDGPKPGQLVSMDFLPRQDPSIERRGCGSSPDTCGCYEPVFPIKGICNLQNYSWARLAAMSEADKKPVMRTVSLIWCGHGHRLIQRLPDSGETL